MSLASQIAKNTIYQIIGKLLATILGLITVGLMTRYLGQAGFGYYTTIIAFMQLFGVLIDFGLQMTSAHLLAKAETDEQKVFNNIFTLRFFSALLFFGLAVIIVWFLPYPLIIKQGISIVSFSFFFVSLQSVLISVFQKNLAMGKIALAEVWGRVTLLVAVWLAVANQKDLLFLIAAVVLSNLVSFAILFFAACRYYPIRFKFDWRLWKKIWSMAWPLAMSIALSLIYFRADTIILSFSRPQNEVGIYGATYKVLEILIQFPYLFLGLILPLLSKFFIINKNLFHLIFQKVFDFLVILVLPMIFATLILGEKIMVFVAGKQFIVSGDILRVLIFAVGLIYLKALFGYTIAACELQKKMIKFYLIDAALSIILYLILIPRYSYWAAAHLTVMSELIAALSAFYILKKYIKLPLKLKIIIKAAAASLIMSAVLLPLINQHLLILVVIGLIIYFWALYLMKGISKKTVLELIKPKY